jgi:4'-phosphopantetheinyl transferase
LYVGLEETPEQGWSGGRLEMDVSVAATDPRRTTRDGQVAVWVLSPSTDRLAAPDVSSVLSAEERAQAERLRRDRDRAVYVRTRVFLRQLLAGYLHVGVADVVLGAGAEGKPEVIGASCRGWPYFNVSHSGSVSLIAVSERGEVGVDVELVRDDGTLRDVALAFFSATEVAAISRLPRHERRDAFFDCWVRKEAYLKGLGTGLRRATTDFDVPLGPAGGIVRDHARAAGARSTWHVYPLDVGRGYAAALAVEGEPRVTIHRP